MLPTIKASGMLPIAYGDMEKSPGIHLSASPRRHRGSAGGERARHGRVGPGPTSRR